MKGLEDKFEGLSQEVGQKVHWLPVLLYEGATEEPLLSRW